MVDDEDDYGDDDDDDNYKVEDDDSDDARFSGPGFAPQPALWTGVRVRSRWLQHDLPEDSTTTLGPRR